jgi:hypothetical protein
VYESFLGTWILIPESCQYDQGAAPVWSRYVIGLNVGELVFTIDWMDEKNESHQVMFKGKPDGQEMAFDGGAIADAISVEAVSSRELTTSAFKNGHKVMVAQRQLDETGQAMRVIQVVYDDSGDKVTNIGVYQKQPKENMN